MILPLAMGGGTGNFPRQQPSQPLSGGLYVAEYKYRLSNEWKEARERLSQLEAVWDPWTIRNFGKVGVREGWHCLEIAGGGGSIAEWLCRQVGSSGHVVATDLEPRFLEVIDASNLEVRRHDILREPLPEGKFDLVHARAVLMFLPQPAETIIKIAAALRPGGWLLIEEPTVSRRSPILPWRRPLRRSRRRDGMRVTSHLQSQGCDTEFGRHLYYYVAMNGLGDLQAEGFVPMQ